MTIKITSAAFITSAVRLDQCPVEQMPEFALVGRSNVGKSSLINKMLNRRHLAKTSGSPGKTQLINFFRVNGAFHLVDLPGYGYARVGKEVKSQWGPMVESYLQKRFQLRLVIQLLDIRHAPSREDKLMHAWLQEIPATVMTVCTKADKVSRGSWAKQQKLIRSELGVSSEYPLWLTSADSGYGIDPLWDAVAQYIQSDGESLPGAE